MFLIKLTLLLNLAGKKFDHYFVAGLSLLSVSYLKDCTSQKLSKIFSSLTQNPFLGSLDKQQWEVIEAETFFPPIISDILAFYHSYKIPLKPSWVPERNHVYYRDPEEYVYYIMPEWYNGIPNIIYKYSKFKVLSTFWWTSLIILLKLLKFMQAVCIELWEELRIT